MEKQNKNQKKKRDNYDTECGKVEIKLKENRYKCNKDNKVIKNKLYI